MNCIIIEDQLAAQRLLTQYISDVPSLHLVGTFSNAVDALLEIEKLKVDLIFLDIHLPKISGLDFLKSLESSPQVILTTAFSEYALESYEFNVVDYLLKPFSFQRFLKAVVKLHHDKEENAQQSPDLDPKLNVKQETDDLFFKSGHEYIRLIPSEVHYIKSDLEYTEIHMSGKKYISSDSLIHWEGLLKDYGFIRVHKSFLLNSYEISRVSGSQIFLKSDTCIPLGRAYKKEFDKRFLNK